MVRKSDNTASQYLVQNFNKDLEKEINQSIDTRKNLQSQGGRRNRNKPPPHMTFIKSEE
jgi:hypothetical protein